MERWILYLVFLAAVIGYSMFLGWQRKRERQVAEDVGARVAGMLGGPKIRRRRSKFQTVLQAVAILAVVELVAFVTGTDDELHNFLSSCRRGRSW